MMNAEESTQYYIMVEGEKVIVTEDIYRAYSRPFWAEHKRIERESRCRVENGSRCTKECCCCEHQRTGSTLSLNRLEEEGFEASDNTDLAEVLIHKQLYEALDIALNQLVPEDGQLIGMLFFGRLTERQVAAKLGLSQKGVNKRKARILEDLRSKLNDF